MSERFVTQRRGDWQRLEALLARSRARGTGALSAEELVELGYAYRRAAADLATGRRDFPGDRVCLYLNQLVGRAHGVVYQREAGEWRRLVAFFSQGFPALFRETIAFSAAAFLIFSLAAAISFAAVLLAPESAAYLVPETVASAVREQRMWTEGNMPPAPMLAGLIMTNNIRVALLAFAGGVLFGAISFFVLALNGLQLGAVAGICQANGLSLALWSFVAPHGVIELTVVFIAGGSGLRLGHALLRPGLYTRRESLTLAARQVVRLLFGCVPLLVIAGTIEGFLSPAKLPPGVKLAFGALTAALLYGYLLLGGRGPTGSKEPSSPRA